MHRNPECILDRESAVNPYSSNLRLALLYAAGIVFSCALSAQTAPFPPQAQTVPSPIFDVAAIHPHVSQPHEHNSIFSSPFDGRFHAENISVLMLIHWAWEMPETRIVDAPAWAGTRYFNIDAKADASVDSELHNLTSDAGRKLKERMVQSLLTDRFHLVAHIELRQLPIYELVVAKGGPRLGPLMENGSSVSVNNGRIEVQMSNSVAVLAEELSKVVGRNVVDKSGITGRYDLKLRWTPDDRGPDADASGPSIFTALEEQLGLKLEPQRGAVEVLVIDHIELPSEN
jgi:uncharacterized protein (TIGR03435 family)